MKPFTVSVLLRKDEYCSYKAFRLPVFGWGVPMGLFLMFCGVAVWLLKMGTAVTFAFLLTGIGFSLFDSVLAPMLARAVVGARFDRTRQEAWHLTFSEEAVTVKNGRCDGTFPYALLTHAEEAVHYFVFEFGGELSLCVPRRALSPSQVSALQQLIARG